MENQDCATGPPGRRAVAGHGPLGRRGLWVAGWWAFGLPGLFLAKPGHNQKFNCTTCSNSGCYGQLCVNIHNITILMEHLPQPIDFSQS